MEKYYIVEYTGVFGFIKPWTAVRDGLTFSQQFLTPSIVEGMRIKLEVDQILRHKISYDGISEQQETIQSAGIQERTSGKKGEKQKTLSRETSILVRGTMLNPKLTLAFSNKEDQAKAFKEHICLCRNEDVLFPFSCSEISEKDFDQIEGFELLFGKERKGAFLVGYNRFKDGAPMFGELSIVGEPNKSF